MNTQTPKHNNMIRLVLVVSLLWCMQIIYGQSLSSDQKIKDIDAYKKFKIDKTDQNALQAMNNSGDSSIRIIELTSFSRKKDGLGKVMQRSRYQGTEVKRICYFNEATKLFAIRDSIWYENHNTRQLTYYFKNKKLEKAIDSKQQDVTSNINQDELFYLLKTMFDSLEIE